MVLTGENEYYFSRPSAGPDDTKRGGGRAMIGTSILVYIAVVLVVAAVCGFNDDC